MSIPVLAYIHGKSASLVRNQSEILIVSAMYVLSLSFHSFRL